MLSSPLHTCVHCIARITDPSSCLHTCTLWCPRWNVHWYRQSFDWFVTLLHYLFSIKKELLIFWYPNERQSAGFPPRWPPRGFRITQMRGQFSWSRRWADCPLNDATESCSWKIAGSGEFVKSTLCGLYLSNPYYFRPWLLPFNGSAGQHF